MSDLLRIPEDVLRIPGDLFRFFTGLPQDAYRMFSSLSNNNRRIQDNIQTQIGSSGNVLDENTSQFDFPNIPGRFVKSAGQFINDAGTTAGHAFENGAGILHDGINFANAAITAIPSTVANNLGSIQSRASQVVNPFGISIPQPQLSTAATTFSNNPYPVNTATTFNNNPYPANAQTGNGVTSFFVNGAYSSARNGNINRCTVANDGQTIIVRRNGNIAGTMSNNPYDLVDLIRENCDIRLSGNY